MRRYDERFAARMRRSSAACMVSRCACDDNLVDGYHGRVMFFLMNRMVFLLWLGAASASWGSQIISRPPTSAALFTNYTAESFRKLAEGRRAIDPENINQRLLDAAVFHETNRRR